MSAAQQKRNKTLAAQLERMRIERDMLRSELHIAKDEIRRLRTDGLSQRESLQTREGVSFW